MSSFIQNIIIVGGVLVLLGLGYFMYTQAEYESTDVDMEIAAESEAFLRRLEELKTIDLNGDLFDDPRFISLVNYSVPVLTEEVGNPTPFDRN